MSKRWVWIVFLFPLLIQASGCATLLTGAVAGAGGVVWIKGKLREEVNVSVSKVHEAVLKSLQELELPVKEDKKDKLTAKVKSEFADGKHVWIDIQSLTETSTRITIRVGIWGDEIKSRKLLDTIHHHM